MKYILAFFLIVSIAHAQGTLYIDTRTNQVLAQSASPSLIGTSTANITTVAIQYPLPLGGLNYWNGATIIGPTAAQDRAFSAASVRRDLWHLQSIRPLVVANGTTAELNLLDRDIELLQRRAAAILAGR
jgi:hypothetical protein